MFFILSFISLLEKRHQEQTGKLKESSGDLRKKQEEERLKQLLEQGKKEENHSLLITIIFPCGLFTLPRLY